VINISLLKQSTQTLVCRPESDGGTVMLQSGIGLSQELMNFRKSDDRYSPNSVSNRTRLPGETMIAKEPISIDLTSFNVKEPVKNNLWKSRCQCPAVKVIIKT